METFVKIGFTKIFLAAQKIWVAQNLGGGGGGAGTPQLPRPVRSWVLTPVSSIKHIIVSLVNLISLRRVCNLYHH